ncbi:uncharacterized protein BT62DRAFT_985785 [Guyanagaster necrorhizus]|uniref:Kinetochore protein Sos7 coiled-coil domain-containing protein n=1 Tax=Guyanagaster necrorhizus TaxID=856835 RepID=A0A9P7VWZ0_9AGAR|nr:uncharacterized protein BT62DRAFT_985785 [Guyanagaster necrorhizus MCA 3950]KAG7448442.1 hypothetical protein BT62DRAFT_985785 [Guyanagaster necrorhizus MCA 3950]
MDREQTLAKAQAFQDLFEKSRVRIAHHSQTFTQAAADAEDVEVKDPSIIASDVAAQIAFFRKLKFQYLEQNAKDKYVKSIVSNIDDAPIVTAEDNRNMKVLNDQRKEKLKSAKKRLAEVQQEIRVLAPSVETDFNRVKEASSQAVDLSKRIIDARLALTRLRQTYPQPRLTVQSADQKLATQIVEMQELTDEIEEVTNNVKEVKGKVKGGALEVENLRMQRAEVEKSVKVDVDDGKWLPLYDWFTASLTLHRSIINLTQLDNVSDNEMRLIYKVDISQSDPRYISIAFIFVPGTRQLAAVQVGGIEDLDIDVSEIIDAHVQVNDVQGVVAAVIARIRSEA